MRIMNRPSSHRLPCPILLLMIACLASAALADPVTTLFAWGDFERSSWREGAPSPDLWLTWQHVPQEGPFFDGAVVDAPTAGHFVFISHADEFYYHGSWSRQDDDAEFEHLELQVELGCTLQVYGRIILTLRRDLAVPLQPSAHWFEVTDPDLTTTTYFGDATGDEVQIELAWGVYEIRALIDLRYDDVDDTDVSPACDSRLSLAWEEIQTPVAASTWGAIKSLYQ